MYERSTIQRLLTSIAPLASGGITGRGIILCPFAILLNVMKFISIVNGGFSRTTLRLLTKEPLEQ